MRLVSIYIHIPFCVQICGYCDFAVTHLRRSVDIKEYLKVLKREITSRSEPISPLRAPSIYFGGGTPSLVPAKDLEGLMKVLNRFVHWDKTAEITFEANPNTFDLKTARAWRRLGINRISLGVQTFNPRTLKLLGRKHTAEESTRSFEILRKAGFKNINLDLIYGLPKEKTEDFQTTLTQAICLQPEHISLYQLAVEKNTRFEKLYRQNKLSLPTEEETAAMYETACQKLKQAGFRHYELQNFSRAGYESTHNRRYWNHEEYLGFGTGSFSYWNGERFGHGKSTADYLSKGKRGDFTPDITEWITDDLKTKESIILGLRMKDGVDLKILEKTHCLGVPDGTIEQLNRLSLEGLLIKNDSYYRLSPRGELLSESVARELV